MGTKNDELCSVPRCRGQRAIGYNVGEGDVLPLCNRCFDALCAGRLELKGRTWIRKRKRNADPD